MEPSSTLLLRVTLFTLARWLVVQTNNVAFVVVGYREAVTLIRRRYNMLEDVHGRCGINSIWAASTIGY
jgi:hypothetical protein